MLLFIFLALFLLLVGIWETATCTCILNKKNALFAKRVSCFLGGAGVLTAIGVLTVYFIMINRYTAENSQVIKDIFFVYALVATGLFAVCFAVAGISALIKNKLYLLVPMLCSMWSALVLFWTYVCSAWSHFHEFSLYPFILVYGISLCLVLKIPSVPVIAARYQLLSDEKSVQAIKDGRAKRKEAARLERERAKRTAEKKKKLKNPKTRE